jgi:SAM-dependent methyltransferase
LCNVSVVDFFVRHCGVDEFRDKRVLEIGSKSINGSVRSLIERFLSPGEYIGTDIEEGENVDRVVPAESLPDVFGEESFDIVVSTEVLEHIKDWRIVVDNIKKVLRSGGLVYLTTRSKGFFYHGYPYDFWRYEVDDLKEIFGDFEIIAAEEDPSCPGSFIKVRKPESGASPVDLSSMQMYSVVLGKRTGYLPDVGEMPFHKKALIRISKTPIWGVIPWHVKALTA